MTRSAYIRLRIFLIGVILALFGTFSSASESVSTTTDAVANEQNVRQIIAQAIVADTSAAQQELVLSLAKQASQSAVDWLTKWKKGEIFLYQSSEGKKIPVVFDAGVMPQTMKIVATGEPVIGADGKPATADSDDLETVETDSGIRKAMKVVTDLVALSDPLPAKRLRAVQDAGLEQNPLKLPLLEARKASETEAAILKALDESIAIINLKNSAPAVVARAMITLGTMGSIPSQGAIKDALKVATTAGHKEVLEAGARANQMIENHISTVNTLGTLFRGLSTGSVLLVVAIGLAITFGLMGVINMAHGELIVVGAYTVYVVQNIFAKGMELSPFGIKISLPGMNLQGAGWDAYFLVALPASFITAALVGLLLERTVIRFLYKRPLESLLATWGVSLVLQQLFRMVFGANNVQVSSPSWLSGNWTVNDILFGWSRVFVICFAVLIIILTWLVLNKTSLGLLIRAVMQNRGMAACMGVRTERVNMLTFAFGSGLAGLAGAFLSQIGNVGPSLGQNYIVDAFMTVVVGGVGNLMGTVISALGIGIVDQSLQQILENPVLGKILVLGAIILFLQWRPAGIFVTKSRSLEN